jgi:glucosamine--fructose-6-phosphate aminotransferase (isomerizing)
MLKEIAEQPTAVADTLLGHFEAGRIVLDEQRLSDQELREIDKVFIVACGTAYHSGLVAKYAIEHWTRIPVEVELASEFRYRDPVLDRSTLVIAISQSGETADTLEAVRHAKTQKAKVLAVCNTNGSQIPREADAVLYTRAGPEIGVAATKTFLAQVTANYLVGLALAQARGTKYPDEVEREYRELDSITSRPSPNWAAGTPTPRRCSSSAATWAIRSPWRGHSSSRNWPTCTPRASPPVNSNTARSR